MERLAETAARRPFQAVQCAALIIAGDAEGWVPRLHQEELRKILGAVLTSDDPTAKSAATDLVNRLLARGETGFRDLLK
jgi:hypothetical protein